MMIAFQSFGQVDSMAERLGFYETEFRSAYQQYPELHPGILEAMVWYHSKGIDLQPSESCIGIPQGKGLFGLIDDGKGFFINNQDLVISHSQDSNIDFHGSPENQILAMSTWLATQENTSLLETLLRISMIPEGNQALEFARYSEAYGILSLLNDRTFQSAVPHAREINLESIFGNDLQILKSSSVTISGDEISGDNGTTFRGDEIGPCFDYAADAYVQTPTCNYNARSEPISAVTVHTIQGSYAGAIGWAQNCVANVSYHYVVRSSDGQVTQMLCEADRGWHVGTENDYAIGIEHEGYVSDPTWYTPEMYSSSSSLVRDITNSGYGIDPHRTAHFPWAATTHYNVSSIPGSCNKIKGHQHFPNQTHTDPGANWHWDLYYRMIDPPAARDTLTNPNGMVTDDGGEIGPYSVDGRWFTLIQPAGATTIDLTFSDFDLENEWDYLYIYDGETEFHPLIGVYTGQTLPSMVTSSAGSLLLEFRSDCSISYAGWVANYTSDAVTVGIETFSSELQVYPNPTTGVVRFNQPVESVTVLDLTGKVVGFESKNIRSVDLSEYGAEFGMYVLRVDNLLTSRNIKIAFISGQR